MEKSGPITWVFFDLGSTLVDESQADLQRFDRIRQILAAGGRPASQEELMRCMEDAAAGFSGRFFLGMLERLGLDKSLKEAVLRDAVYSHERERLYPGAAELVADLAGSYRLGVIANQSLGAEERLNVWGIRRHFSSIHSSGELGLEKPDPRIFELALRETGCPADQAVMVGDRLENDMAPAKKLGFRTLRVVQGIARVQQPRDEFERPDREVHTLEEIREALMSL
jgi:HAD superfamily hydrolase (TIGR01509 family)